MIHTRFVRTLGATFLTVAIIFFVSSLFTGTVHASGTLTNFSLTTSSHVPSATATYTFTYTTATDLTPGDLIFRPSFPVGFDLSTTTITNVSVTLNGSPETVTEYWYGGAPANQGGLLYVRVQDDIPAGTVVVVSLSGVGNPASAGVYTIPFKTADGGGNTLDTPASDPTVPIFSFAGGDGSVATPWQISTCDQLQYMQYSLSSSYILNNNIDCKATNISNSSDPNYDAYLYNSGAGFAPVGDDTSRFTGTFDGNNHVILNLAISNSSLQNGIGLFGAVDTGGTVKNVGIMYGSMPSSYGYAGMLIGENHGTVQDVFVSAAVNSGGNFAGVLVGVNSGSLTDTYSTGSISANGGYVGGLSGFNSGSIMDSYSTATVTGNSFAGGLNGRLFGGGTMTNVFATGAVNGSQSGAISGTDESGTAINAYWSSVLSGQSSCLSNSDNTDCTNINDNENGISYFYSSESQPFSSFTNYGAHWQDNVNTFPTLVWEGPKIISVSPQNNANNFSPASSLVITFDHSATAVSGKSINIVRVGDGSVIGSIDAGGVSISGNTASFQAMLSPNTTYAIEIEPGAFVDGNSHPFAGITTPSVWQFTTTAFAGGNGTPENPYQINSCAAFEAINQNLAASFEFTSDLICDGEGNHIMINFGAFTGTINGNGHVISVAIDNPISTVGIFSTLSGATIKNLQILGSITGNDTVGSLAGVADNNTYIKYILNDASVTSSGITTGGLVGVLNHNSLIADSISQGVVTSNGYAIGGLVGSMFYGGSITRSYASGAVTGGTDVGGLVGKGDTEAGTISNSFAAGHVTGNNSVGGFIGEKVDATLTNDYFDADRTGLGAICASDNADACTYVDGEGSNPMYFIGNNTNPPFDTWDSTYVWDMTSPNKYPLFMQPITAPVGYWKLDDATGSTGVDEIDNIHPVSLQSSPSWTTGNFGGALAFNGSNYANTSLHFSPSGTISLWAYPTQSGDWQSPAGWKLLGAGNGFALIDEGSGGHWRAVFNPDLSGEKDVVASNPIVFNQWSYLTMTWSLDSNSNAYTVHLYVNGVDQGSIEWDGVPGSNGLGGFNIGKSGDYPDNFFNGNVDEVRVFDYALTPEQVAAFAAETSSTTPPVLSSPITAGKYSDTYPMPITFTLPDDMKADTLVLTFTPAVGDPIVIHLKDADSHHPNTFHITPEGGIKSVQEVKNSTSDSIPDGTYSVSLSYRNMAGDPTASTTITGVAILPPLNALAEVTPIASQTTAANAVYTFSNSESNGQYDFTPVLVSPAPNNPVSVHLNPVTHQVTFTGLQVGSTYSTSFTYIIGTQQSNVLTVGPFTVIPDSQTSNGGSAAPVLIAQSSNNNGGNANGVVVETDSGCVQGNTHSATTGISCPTSGVSSNSQTTNDQKLFLKNLKLGMDDPDVARLQHFLATHGFPVSKTGWGSLGHEATTYGKKTQIALAKFQKANGIKPASGYFGPQTRKFVNAMILANK